MKMGPGDLVVCVDLGFFSGSGNQKRELSKLVIGDVYTVAESGIGPTSHHARIRLYEVRNETTGWWNAARFRPCRKTDIGSLEALAKEREREVVE
jgi:hypothetical protein